MYFSVKAFLASVCLLAITHESQASNKPLQCWHCSSDTHDSEDFCGTTFDESSIPVDLLKERNLSVVRTCSDMKISEHERPVCRKSIEEVNGKEITHRQCYYTNKLDPLDLCITEQTDSNVKRIFCEDCLTDKCNSAPKQLNPINSAFTIVLLLPVFIAKVLEI